MGMVADTAGHPSALVTNEVIDLDKITELNTAMATGMDFDEGASPILAYTRTLNETTPKAMDIDTAAASDSDTDRDGITTATDNGPDGTAMATITAMNSNTSRNTEGLVQPDTDGLDPNIGPDSGSDIHRNCVCSQ